MKKVLISVAASLATLSTITADQFYVILKDGSAESYQTDKIDSLSFDEPQGAKVLGLSDLEARIILLEKELASLKEKCNCSSDTTPIGEITPSINIWNSEDSVTVKLADLQEIGLTTDTLVDLGLSVKWANFNLGASNCYENGDYHRFLGTAFYEISISELQKKGIINADSLLTKDYDMATIAWGAKYRMPSIKEMYELRENTESKWLVIEMPDGSNVKGRIAKSKKNGKSVFFPACGVDFGSNGHSVDIGIVGYYWTASASGDGICGKCMYVDPEKFVTTYFMYNDGMAVRPVSNY